MDHALRHGEQRPAAAELVGQIGPPQSPVGVLAGHPYVDPPDDFDDLAKPIHLYQGITVDRDAQVVADRVEEELWASPWNVETLSVDPSRVDAADSVTRQIDVQVARDGDQCRHSGGGLHGKDQD